jgi:transcriptional regulator with XRE-family HTH domain
MIGSHPLKDYREANGLTQEALAGELGVSSITVSRWETGARKIDPELLGAVSEKTGIPKRELRPDLADLLHEHGSLPVEQPAS